MPPPKAHSLTSKKPAAMTMRRHEADRMSFRDLGMPTALIIPTGTANVLWTSRLKQGVFGLDAFLSNFLRHECDS